MERKEIASILIIISVIVLFSSGLWMMYSLLIDEEVESIEVLIAIIGAILLNVGVFVLLKDDLTLPIPHSLL